MLSIHALYNSTETLVPQEDRTVYNADVHPPVNPVSKTLPPHTTNVLQSFHATPGIPMKK